MYMLFPLPYSRNVPAARRPERAKSRSQNNGISINIIAHRPCYSCYERETRLRLGPKNRRDSASWDATGLRSFFQSICCKVILADANLSDFMVRYSHERHFIEPASNCLHPPPPPPRILFARVCTRLRARSVPRHFSIRFMRSTPSLIRFI